MNSARAICMAMLLLIGGCTSTAAHYYTLVPESARKPPPADIAPFRLEVAPVRVPAQVDRLELVTRLPDGGVAIADGERWIAPLADELRNALSIELGERLGGGDPGPGPVGSDLVSVRIQVERFESAPSRYALIEASWTLDVKAHPKDVLVTCRTRAYEPVRGGYPELVRAHQRTIVLIADEIATAAEGAAAGRSALCPSSEVLGASLSSSR
jgi:uncharacterized lipoprotein YmbA